ncbi:6-bladed beta-propeller, partial [Elusimicrobiota bacterium]
TDKKPNANSSPPLSAHDTVGNVKKLKKLISKRDPEVWNTEVYFKTIGTGKETSGNEGFSYLDDIAISKDGNIYVADTLNLRVQVFDKNGRYIRTIGTGEMTSGNEGFDDLHGIAIDKDSNLYVADTQNHRVQVFDKDGTHVKTIGTGEETLGNEGFELPYSVAIDKAGNLYVTDAQNHRVQVFDKNGTYVKTIGRGEETLGNKGFIHPYGVATGKAGKLYAADVQNHRVQVFDKDGTYIRTIGTGEMTSGNEGFSEPQGIAINKHGQLYVADYSNHRVQVFDKNGTYIRTIGTGEKTSGNEGFDHPSGIAIDKDSNLYVADTDNSRVQVYKPLGNALVSKLKDIPENEWGSILEETESLIKSQPDFASWIAVSENIKEALGILSSLSVSLKNMDEERRDVILSLDINPKTKRKFLKKLSKEELRALVLLERILKPSVITSSALNKFEGLLKQKYVRKSRKALRAIWGSIVLADAGHLSLKSLETILGFISKENLNSVRDLFSSLAFGDSSLRKGFDINMMIEKNIKEGSIDYASILESWVNHLSGMMLKKFRFTKKEKEKLNASLKTKHSAWLSNSLYANLMIHSSFLSSTGKRSLKALLLDLAKSPVSKDKERFIYKKRYARVKEVFKDHPEFLKAWMEDYSSPSLSFPSPRPSSPRPLRERASEARVRGTSINWSMHLAQIKDHLGIESADEFEQAFASKVKTLKENLQSGQASQDLERFIPQAPMLINYLDGFMPSFEMIIDGLEQNRAPPKEAVSTLLPLLAKPDLMKHILPEPDNTFADIKNLNIEINASKKPVAWAKALPLRLEVADDPSAMLVMGEEPIETCQSCKEEKGQTKDGELINRIRLGQLKLANIYQGDSLVARTVLEAGLDDKRTPALLVERLYTLPGKNLDISEIESLLISYASHIKANTIYWGDEDSSWPLKNKKTQTKPYKLLSQQRLKLYRDSFSKDGGKAPAIAVPASSPSDPLSLEGRGQGESGAAVSKKNLLSLIALPALAGILAFLGMPDIVNASAGGEVASFVSEFYPVMTAGTALGIFFIAKEIRAAKARPKSASQAKKFEALTEMKIALEAMKYVLLMDPEEQAVAAESLKARFRSVILSWLLARSIPITAATALAAFFFDPLFILLGAVLIVHVSINTLRDLPGEMIAEAGKRGFDPGKARERIEEELEFGFSMDKAQVPTSTLQAFASAENPEVIPEDSLQSPGWRSGGESGLFFTLLKAILPAEPEAILVHDATLGSVEKLKSLISKRDPRIWNTEVYHKTIGTGVKTSRNDGFDYPNDVAIGANSDIYVMDTSNKRAQIFDKNGTYIRTIGTGKQASGDEGFHHPAGIAVGANGDLYVADTYNHRIQIFDKNGQYIKTIGTGKRTPRNDGFMYPYGVTVVQNNDLYVADTDNHRVQVFDKNGTYVRTVGTGKETYSGNDGFNLPRSIAIDNNDNLYVADFRNHRIQVFDKNRTYVRTIGIGERTSGNEGFLGPISIAISGNNDLYVVDTDNNRVQVFDEDGTYIRTIGTGKQTLHNDGFNNPGGIAADKANNIYVVDSWNNRVQVFSPLRNTIASKLKDIPESEWESILDKTESLIRSYPNLAPWIADSENIKEALDILSSLSVSLSKIDEERRGVILGMNIDPKTERKFLKKLNKEEFRALVLLERASKPLVITGSALNEFDKLLKQKHVRKSRKALRAIWGAIILADAGEISAKSLEAVLGSISKQNLGPARDLFNSLAFGDSSLRKGFDINTRIEKGVKEGSIDYASILDLWTNHLSSMMFKRFRFSSEEEEMIKASIRSKRSAWLSNSFYTNLMIHSSFLSDSGKESLRILIIDLAGSPTSMDGERFIYKKRYDKMKEAFKDHPGFLKAWMQEYYSSAGEILNQIQDDRGGKGLSINWSMHLAQIKDHLGIESADEIEQAFALK